jgi:serine/threonine-protein kinase
MGEVFLCRDHLMGRDVAMKVVHRDRQSGRDLRARFLREARVQGQLEHPAIVPVYDLAQDATGRSFFTMKRVRGETLEVVIARLAANHSRTRAEYTRHKLLAAYARVCLAIDFAHARGVVHRDLKPANVMLGDFGEVYVLDWGVAKIDGSTEDIDAEGGLEKSGERLTLRDPDGGRTEAGVILGTPAYMAPEQLRGAPVDARTDVYALGAILFEILTLTSLHDCKKPSMSALPVERFEAATEIPPELSAIWRKATARDPDDRHTSARELHDEVERFLSGDRDLASRKVLVEGHITAARALRAERPETAKNRSGALAEIGRAIALDPNNAEALGILVELLGTPPETPPKEVVEDLTFAESASRKVGLKRAMVFYILPILVFVLPVGLWMGVKSFSCLALCLGSFVVAGVVAAFVHRNPEVTKRVPWVTVVSSFAIATTALLSGSFVILPAFVMANTLGHVVAGRDRHRRVIVCLGVLTMLVPLALELLGLMPEGPVVVDGALLVRSPVFVLSEPLTPIFLVCINVGILIFTSRLVGHYRDALGRAELNHLSQLWQLRQLVPEGVRRVTSEAPPSR